MQELCTVSVERIVEANTLLSGLGAESGGCSAAHAIHNGFTVLPKCHRMYHGKKVAFGNDSPLVMGNVPLDELKDIVNWCIDVGLPLTLAQLSVTEATDEKIMAVAEAACAPSDTMHNMHFRSLPRHLLRQSGQQTLLGAIISGNKRDADLLA